MLATCTVVLCALAPHGGRGGSACAPPRHHSARVGLLQATTTSTGPTSAPSLRALAAFSMPQLGIGLCPPLLGLIDSAVVGRYSGELPLAALAPSVALCDICVYLFRSLAIATTAFVATALADGDRARERREVSNAVLFAACSGVAIGMIVFFGCEPLLRVLSGGSNGEFPMAEACAYARVRALGFPAALVFMVCCAGRPARNARDLPQVSNYCHRITTDCQYGRTPLPSTGAAGRLPRRA